MLKYTPWQPTKKRKEEKRRVLLHLIEDYKLCVIDFVTSYRYEEDSIIKKLLTPLPLHEGSHSCRDFGCFTFETIAFLTSSLSL